MDAFCSAACGVFSSRRTSASTGSDGWWFCVVLDVLGDVVLGAVSAAMVGRGGTDVISFAVVPLVI